MNFITEYIWIPLVAIYGICKGSREGVKKKAMEKDSMMNVLFLYTLIGFLFSVPFAGNPFDIPGIFYLYIFIKSFVIFLSWILSFSVIKKMPISLYGVLDMSRVLFSTFLGITVLGEVLNIPQIIGLSIVIIGLLLVNTNKNNNEEKVRPLYILVAVISCLLNSVSALLDKLLLKSSLITSGQLQFWFMFFMAAMYLVFLFCKKEKPNLSSSYKNLWIVLLSVLLILGDRCLFIANEMPQSKLTIITLVKQCSTLVTIVLGKIMFNEKRFIFRLSCAIFMIGGIMLSVIFN